MVTIIAAINERWAISNLKKAGNVSPGIRGANSSSNGATNSKIMTPKPIILPPWVLLLLAYHVLAQFL